MLKKDAEQLAHDLSDKDRGITAKPSRYVTNGKEDWQVNFTHAAFLDPRPKAYTVRHLPSMNHAG